MKRLLTFAGSIFLALGLTAPALFAQTSVTSTTLAAAVTSTSGTVFTVTSATGFTANATLALVDKELVFVRAVSGTAISVERGGHGTVPSTHASGATIYVGPAAAFNGGTPAGSCTRTNLPYVPYLVAGIAPAYENGAAFDCLGSQWIRTDAPGPEVLGATVASAASITPTGTYFKVSGTTQITTIVVPAGFAPGMSISIEPTAIGSTGTSGNIGLGSTFVVGKVLILTWNGSKWQPSY